MKGVLSALTTDAAPCMRRTLSTSRGRNVTAQAASTVVRTPMPSPGIALQLKGLQEFAVASLDDSTLSTYVQRDVQVIPPPPLLSSCSLAATGPLPAIHAPSSQQLLTSQSTSYVSRRRLDAADFDPDETDNEGAVVSGALPGVSGGGDPSASCAHHSECAAGLPLVYNEAKIAAYWRNKPGELARRWGKFARISGVALVQALIDMPVSGWACTIGVFSGRVSGEVCSTPLECNIYRPISKDSIQLVCVHLQPRG